jgi:hypothetical protein
VSHAPSNENKSPAKNILNLIAKTLFKFLRREKLVSSNPGVYKTRDVKRQPQIFSFSFAVHSYSLKLKYLDILINSIHTVFRGH